jgi:HSP20 family protein
MPESIAVHKAGRTPPVRIVGPDQMFEDMRTTFDAIARRAFEIFDWNGRRLGRDLDDWFQAEAELLHPVHITVAEADGTLTVRAEVPGFRDKDIEVTVDPERLTIRGQRESTNERQKGKTMYSERCANQFYRVIELPAAVNTRSDALKATYNQGILTITLPKAEQVTGRQIKVESASA